MPTRVGWVFVNPYLTLVAAYEHLIGARGTEIKPGDPVPPLAAVPPVIEHVEPPRAPPAASVTPLPPKPPAQVQEMFLDHPARHGLTGLFDTHPSIDDRIAAQAKAQNKSLDEIRQAFVDRQPLGRLGTAEEIAWMAVYLASDESSYTTGQAFSVDGGFAL